MDRIFASYRRHVAHAFECREARRACAVRRGRVDGVYDLRSRVRERDYGCRRRRALRFLDLGDRGRCLQADEESKLPLGQTPTPAM